MYVVNMSLSKPLPKHGLRLYHMNINSAIILNTLRGEKPGTSTNVSRADTLGCSYINSLGLHVAPILGVKKQRIRKMKSVLLME